MTDNFASLFSVAVILDIAIGDPKNFFHPVRLIGTLINFLSSRLCTGPHDFSRGLVLCVMTLSVTGLSVWGVLYLTGYNSLVQIYLLYSAIAWRDLKDETAVILHALMRNNIDDARKYLSFVVGRDTGNLCESEIISATIETISENSIDGVISVMFYAFIGSLINASCLLVWLFKASSTLDSMIGYEKFQEFGKFAAKLDDALNFIPARLGGVIIACCNVQALRVFFHDRLNHKSPNSAHGESAFAGALDIKLGGGAFYDGRFVARPVINSQGKDCELYDIVKAWRLLDRSCALFAVIILITVLILRNYTLRLM
ncbi:MAG: cobalamin biosynthesis protein CobD [Synergistaceae bacterium]|nr:cobalamin biosynthesis protein CobD [Synergistaceae bacterium]